MLAPNYSANDFQAALQKLMPRGRVWPTSPDSIQAKTLYGLAGIFEKNSADAAALLKDAFPLTTIGLLPEWESTLGLPDPIIGQLPTIQQRQALVVARLCNMGGQSIPYIIGYAANLGFIITITEFAPARIGKSRIGDPLYGPAWAFAWQVNGASVTVTRSRVGSSVVGEALCVWGNEQLFNELNRISPAHTVIIYSLS